MKLLFDLDNTIIKIDSDFEWNFYINKIKSNKKNFIKNILSFLKYNKNILNIYKYNVFVLKTFSFFKKNCKIINYIYFFYKKIIRNKIKNKTIYIINISKLIKKILISTSTNKNISKIINYFFNIKLSLQNNIKITYINMYVIYNNYLKSIINYKSKKIKKLFIFNNTDIKNKYILYTDSKNDAIWNKKKIICTNPDKILLNNSLSNKTKILFEKKIKKLFC